MLLISKFKKSGKFNSGATGKAMLTLLDKEDGIAYTKVLPEIVIEDYGPDYRSVPTLEDLLSFTRPLSYTNKHKQGFGNHSTYFPRKFKLEIIGNDTNYFYTMPYTLIPRLLKAEHVGNKISPNFYDMLELYNKHKLLMTE